MTGPPPSFTLFPYTTLFRSWMIAISTRPPLLLLWGFLWAALRGGAAWLAMSGASLPMLRFYRCPAVLAPLLPAIALFYMAATVGSAIQFWRGRGGQWKGRYQAAASS